MDVRKKDVRKKSVNVLEAAGRIISYKMRSESQVREKLADKGFNIEEIEYAISTLKEDGYIDDWHYALSYAEYCLGRNMGSYRILHELKKQGIPAEIIGFAIEEMVDKEKEKSLAVAEAGKVVRSWNKDLLDERGYVDQRLQQRIGRRLEGKGFDGSTIRIAISYICDEIRQEEGEE